MDEIKALLQSLVDKALCAKNEKDEEDEEDEDKKAENKKAKNEEVDKRDIIRQIMAIAGKEEASEDVKTIAKLAEKLAYDKSEADTADNCKAKNEDEEDDDDKEDKKEAAENEDGEMEYEELKEKVQKEAENKKKAKNALDEVKKVFFEGHVESTSKYMSQKDGIELGKKLY